MLVLTIQGSGMAKRTWLLVAVGVLGALVVWRQSRPEAPAALLQWTNIVALRSPPPGLDWDGVDAHPAVKEAVHGLDPDRLRDALEDVGLQGLWVGVYPEAVAGGELPLAERFASGGVVRGFRGEALTSEGLLYVVDHTHWPVVLADRVLARVARGILEGSAPPPLDAFPEELARHLRDGRRRRRLFRGRLGPAQSSQSESARAGSGREGPLEEVAPVEFVLGHRHLRAVQDSRERSFRRRRRSDERLSPTAVT